MSLAANRQIVNSEADDRQLRRQIMALTEQAAIAANIKPRTKTWAVLRRLAGYYVSLQPQEVAPGRLEYAGWPSYATLCEDLGMSRSTLIRCLREGEAAGLIDRVRRYDPDHRGRETSSYACLTFLGRGLARQLAPFDNGEGVTVASPGCHPDTPRRIREGSDDLDRLTDTRAPAKVQDPEPDPETETLFEGRVQRLYGGKLTPLQREEVRRWEQLPPACQKSALAKVDDRRDRIAAVPSYLRATFAGHGQGCGCGERARDSRPARAKRARDGGPARPRGPGGSVAGIGVRAGTEPSELALYLRQTDDDEIAREAELAREAGPA